MAYIALAVALIYVIGGLQYYYGSWIDYSEIHYCIRTYLESNDITVFSSVYAVFKLPLYSILFMVIVMSYNYIVLAAVKYFNTLAYALHCQIACI